MGELTARERALMCLAFRDGELNHGQDTFDEWITHLVRDDQPMEGATA